MSVVDLPYRPNAGIALFNRDGLVLIAKRLRDDGPERIYPGHEWQMPQGGVDPNEDFLQAAYRELREETQVISVDYLAETEWFAYDFPPYHGPPHRFSVFRGQRQKWFAMRFTGDDSEIDISVDGSGDPPEFSDWRWEKLDRVAELVVPFRRDVYRNVAQQFAPFAVPMR
ncbi:RNA pyrophosphohydrolase [Variibacter gotjawalensis]|uniref:RNA pyrophosphohydrolase n=1 Tax=Variibacter gotjawalensis TaxID=1333996 RepID=A0A0S3PRR5_9BRAD|nr:RNA pyrophosphohydrolase [Variibacter gotjawalensis]RZS50817.1 putative (di)nucleoside polyphosphate hydrolase [Variibacter gotjawalensis]BAT58651.1 RNA pyrophosphohydrolase [Variibacter gotjawalensis]